MLPDWTVVGFTGHRNIGDSESTAESIRAVLDDLGAKRRSILAIASLAKGSDTLFVEEVTRRKIPFLLVLPFPKARFQQDFEPEEWQRLELLMARAFHIEEVCGADSDEEAYMETGVRTVDRADVVIAVWDGKPAAGFGGTGDVVAYARALSRPLKWLNPVTGDVVNERLERLPAIAGSTNWSDDPHQTIEEQFRKLDKDASHRAPKERHLIQQIVLLQLIVSASGLVSLGFAISGTASYAIALFELAVLGTAFVLISVHKRVHREWINTRIEAEICRSFLATWPMRAKLVRLPTLAIRGFERLMRNLRLIQQLDGSSMPRLETACEEYMKSRVQNQIGYFSRHSNGARRTFQKLNIVAQGCMAAALLLAASHFFFSLYHLQGKAITTVDVVSLVLPLVSTALFSLILIQEHSRRAQRYHGMAIILRDAAQRLKAVRTWNGLTSIAMETEEQLLNEAVEWQSFRQITGEIH